MSPRSRRAHLLFPREHLFLFSHAFACVLCGHCAGGLHSSWRPIELGGGVCVLLACVNGRTSTCKWGCLAFLAADSLRTMPTSFVEASPYVPASATAHIVASPYFPAVLADMVASPYYPATSSLWAGGARSEGWCSRLCHVTLFCRGTSAERLPYLPPSA